MDTAQLNYKIDQTSAKYDFFVAAKVSPILGIIMLKPSILATLLYITLWDSWFKLKVKTTSWSEIENLRHSLELQIDCLKSVKTIIDKKP